MNNEYKIVHIVQNSSIQHFKMPRTPLKYFIEGFYDKLYRLQENYTLAFKDSASISLCET